MDNPNQNVSQSVYKILAMAALIMVMAAVVFMIIDHPGVMEPMASK